MYKGDKMTYQQTQYYEDSNGWNLKLTYMDTMNYKVTVEGFGYKTKKEAERTAKKKRDELG